ncbi:MAG: diguanylate cyclase domain-containing protein [Thiobacillus sp.]
MSPVIAPSSKTVSLKRQWVLLLAGVVGLFALGIALSLWVSLRAGAQSEERHLRGEAEQAVVGLVRVMDYHRAVLANVVRDPEFAELLRAGTAEEQQAWAVARQRLLPDVLALALIDAHGEVLGDPQTLHIGPACLADLRRAKDLNQLRPVLHNGTGGPPHVDLVATLPGDEGGRRGAVFLSLRLAQLQRVIDDALDPGHALVLLDGASHTLVRAGAVEGPVREVRMTLPGTDWTLVAQSPVRTLTRDGEKQALVGLLTLLAVLTLLGITLTRLRRTVLRDVDATRDALAALARDEPVAEIVPHYAEFQPAFADIHRIALNLQDQRVRLEYLSLTDPLTGLPNRRALENHFAQVQGLAAREHHVALVLLDVDHFKTVNDTLGHGVGDQVLRALAESLKTLTRRADLAARLAGDEFVVLLTHVEAGGLEAWYQRLADHFRNELAALGLEVPTGLSAGQTWIRKTPDETIGDALSRADRALYRAKARGRGQLVTEAAG